MQYLTQLEAQNLDVSLMHTPGFSIDQVRGSEVIASDGRILGSRVLIGVSSFLCARVSLSMPSVPSQLMELAGLSVACATEAVYPPSSHARALVVAGPGNNG